MLCESQCEPALCVLFTQHAYTHQQKPSAYQQLCEPACVYMHAV